MPNRLQEIKKAITERDVLKDLLGGIVYKVGDFKVESEERRKAVADLTKRCVTLQSQLSEVWVDSFGVSENLRLAAEEIRKNLTSVQEDCEIWKANWSIRQELKAESLQDDIRSWHRTVNDCWNILTVAVAKETLEVLNKDPAALTPLIRHRSALEVLENALHDAGPSVDPEVSALIEAGLQDLRSKHLNEQEQQAVFAALSKVLSADTVPESVKLSGKVTVTNRNVRENEFSIIDQGLYGNTVVAIKRLHDKSAGPTRAGKHLSEGTIWALLVHDNILPFYGIVIQSDPAGLSIALISEWATNGNIMEFLTRFPDSDRLRFVEQIACAIEYLHNRSLIHGGIRGSNILIDAKHTAKLTDFALMSSDAPEVQLHLFGQSTGSGIRNIRWLAPELVDEWIPAKSCDIFSFGRTILEILSGEPPQFEDHNDHTLQVVSSIRQGLKTRRPDGSAGVACRKRGLTDSLWELLQDMWAQRPEKRPTIEAVRMRLQSNAAH